MVVNYKPYYPPVYYSLEIVVSEPEAGTVTGMGRYQQGETVTLHAYANSRGVFQGWYMNGALLSAEESYTVTVDGDMKIVAKFAMVWQISTAVDPEGSGSATGAGRYTDGDTVTLIAQSGEGYIFTHWADAAGEAVSESAEYSFQASADVTLTAHFAVLCTVTILPVLEGAGTVTGAGDYPYGSQATISAQNNTGYVFTGWMDADGTVVSTEADYTFTITEDVTFAAAFEEESDSRLPKGYTELQYIISDMECGIDTGVKINLYKTHVVLDLEADSYSGSNSQSIWGLYDNRNYPYFSLTRTSATQLRYALYTSRFSYANTDITGKRIIISFQNRALIVDGNTIASTNLTTTPNQNFVLFSYVSTYSSILAKIYSCQISENETVLRDFVPCINSEGEPGLFDLIENKFYGNLWTGTFTPGPAV